MVFIRYDSCGCRYPCAFSSHKQLQDKLNANALAHRINSISTLKNQNDPLKIEEVWDEPHLQSENSLLKVVKSLELNYEKGNQPEKAIIPYCHDSSCAWKDKYQNICNQVVPFNLSNPRNSYTGTLNIVPRANQEIQLTQPSAGNYCHGGVVTTSCLENPSKRHQILKSCEVWHCQGCCTHQRNLSYEESEILIAKTFTEPIRKWTYNRPSPIHAERFAELELVSSVCRIPQKKYPSTKHSRIEEDLHSSKKMLNEHEMDITLSSSPSENQRLYGKCDGSISMLEEDDPKLETCSTKFLDRPKLKDEGRSRPNLDENHILKDFQDFKHKTSNGKDAIGHDEPLPHLIFKKPLEIASQFDRVREDAQLGNATNMQATTGSFYPNSSQQESNSGGLSPKCQFCDNDVKRSRARDVDVTLDHLRTRTPSPCKRSSPKCETQLCACGHNSNSKKRRWPNNGSMDITDLHLQEPTKCPLKRQNMQSRTNSRSSSPRNEMTIGNFGNYENCCRPYPVKSCEDQVKTVKNMGSQTPSSASCSPSGRSLINGIPMNESVRSMSPLISCPFEDYFDHQRKSYQRNKEMRDYLNSRKQHKSWSSPSCSFEEQFKQQKKARQCPTKDNDKIKLQQQLSPLQRTTRAINKTCNMLSTQRMKAVPRTSPSPCARMCGGGKLSSKPSTPCGYFKNCSNLSGNGHNVIGDNLTRNPHVNLSNQSKGDLKSNTGQIPCCHLNANIASEPCQSFGSGLGLDCLKLTACKNLKSSSNGPMKDQDNIQIITPSSSEGFADLDHIISMTNLDPPTRSTSPRGHPGDVDRNFVKANISSACRAYEGLNLQ